MALAGFKTVLGTSLVKEFKFRMLNIHPSLLPAFPGTHAVRDALAYGVRYTGTTIHWVVPEVDAGPILLQEPVVVMPGDTEESLSERINEVEQVAYPRLIKLLLD